jgi:hypothetical protein
VTRLRQQLMLRRVFAGAMLATLALSLVAPSVSGGLAGTRDCPLAPASDSQRAALVGAMADGACEHSDAGPCLGALGCVTAPPAIAIVPTSLLVPADLISVGIRSTPRVGDLYRAGPPTPPPNQI